MSIRSYRFPVIIFMYAITLDPTDYSQENIFPP